jgi:hypothetical protein
LRRSITLLPNGTNFGLRQTHAARGQRLAPHVDAIQRLQRRGNVLAPLRDTSRYWFPMPPNDDLLAHLDPIEQFRQPCLGFVGANRR